MKKITKALIVTLLFSSSVYAKALSSQIALPGGGIVAPMSMIKISLDPLMKGVEYAVVCSIKNDSPVGVDMRFDIDMPHNGNWLGFYLNDEQLEHLQGTLNPGMNTSMSQIVTLGNGNFVTFINLDTTNKVSVENCVGRPLVGK